MQPNPTSASDVYDFDVYVMMLQSATEHETFELVVDVNGQPEQIVEFTAGGPASYPVSMVL